MSQLSRPNKGGDRVVYYVFRDGCTRCSPVCRSYPILVEQKNNMPEGERERERQGGMEGEMEGGIEGE